MYLLDTNIVSELRKAKPHGAVVSWLAEINDRDLFLSAVTLGEIQRGVEITREQDKEKAAAIETWLNKVMHVYNILPLDGEIFLQHAKLMHKKSDVLYEDAMIAATALVHHLTVVTRNIRDFRIFQVDLLNPFEHESFTKHKKISDLKALTTTEIESDVNESVLPGYDEWSS